MLSVDCIVKLGGSAVTRKDCFETAKLDDICGIGELLRAQRPSGGRCILVHGAGSFGHFQAKEYAVSPGYPASQDEAQINHVQTGFCKTRVSVTKLNNIIVNELVIQGIKAVGLSTCGHWVTDNGKVVKSETDSIRDLLMEGYQPVVHGDCVLDKHRGSTILSGDTVIEVLTSVFQPKRVIFLTDIDGVYDKPPSDPHAQLLPVITVTQDGRLSIPIATSCQRHDVTGGIMKKLSSAVSIVTISKGQTSVFVCRINSKAASNVFIHGDFLGEKGTEIKMETGSLEDEDEDAIHEQAESFPQVE